MSDIFNPALPRVFTIKVNKLNPDKIITVVNDLLLKLLLDLYLSRYNSVSLDFQYQNPGTILGTINAKLMGMVILRLTDDEGITHSFEFTNVNYLPDSPVNLLSLCRLAELYPDATGHPSVGAGEGEFPFVASQCDCSHKCDECREQLAKVLAQVQVVNIADFDIICKEYLFREL